MGYRALITLVLPGSTDEKRNGFYNSLKEVKWHKLPGLTTAWKVLFGDIYTRAVIVDELEKDLLKAKTDLKIKTVEYAIQVSEEILVVNTI